MTICVLALFVDGCHGVSLIYFLITHQRKVQHLVFCYEEAPMFPILKVILQLYPPACMELQELNLAQKRIQFVFRPIVYDF